MEKLEIEIVEKQQENKLLMTRSQVENFIQQNGLYQLITDFNIDESNLYSLNKFYTKQEFLQLLKSGKYAISEDLINTMLDDDYLEKNDLSELAMNIYANLSKEFINEYSEFLDWNRMMVFLSCNEEISDFSDYIDIIEEKDLWNIISSNQLDIDFIRAHKEKLNWRLVSFLNDFTDEEREEFKENILEKQYVDGTYHQSDISIQEIERIISNYDIDSKKQEIVDRLNEKMKDLTKEDVEKLSKIIDIMKK